ncbi:MAG: class I SAM-dependent methyltransferase [Sulfurimonas sp.]
MPTIDNEKFYLGAIKKHGVSARGVNWNSQIHQRLRFDQFKKLLPDDLHNFTLTDAGCGFGDLYHYLDPKPKKYIGVDILEQMIDIANERCKGEFVQIDLTTESPNISDYIVCSGALNILKPYETSSFIQNCYKASKKAFIFNCLIGRESDTFNYLDRPFIEDLAEFLGVNEVKYIQDYIPNDLTIGFFR